MFNKKIERKKMDKIRLLDFYSIYSDTAYVLPDSVDELRTCFIIVDNVKTVGVTTKDARVIIPAVFDDIFFQKDIAFCRYGSKTFKISVIDYAVIFEDTYDDFLDFMNSKEAEKIFS